MTIAHRKAIDITRAAARRAVPLADVPEPIRNGRTAGTWTSRPPLPRSPAGSGRRSPTTTWQGCPTPTSPR